jgi:hypothetical protein
MADFLDESGRPMIILRQIGIDEWDGDGRPLAVLPWEPDEMPLEFTDTSDDLDRLKMAVVEARDGWRFAFLRYQNSPRAGVGVFVVASDSQMSDALYSLLKVVELPAGGLGWISPLAAQPEAPAVG